MSDEPHRPTPIPRGYYLKARCITKSKVAHAPPHVREVWDYCIHHAFFEDGDFLKRGELSTSYDDIRDALSWHVGFRKERYSRSKIERAMKWLRKHGMCATRRTTHGFIITVCNYDLYQNPKNYESRNESRWNATHTLQGADTTDKKVKEHIRNKELSLEGDEVYQLLLSCGKLGALTPDQDSLVREEFKTALSAHDWPEMARRAAQEAMLMTDHIRNPALFWRRSIEKKLKSTQYASNNKTDYWSNHCSRYTEGK